MNHRVIDGLYWNLLLFLDHEWTENESPIEGY